MGGQQRFRDPRGGTRSEGADARKEDSVRAGGVKYTFKSSFTLNSSGLTLHNATVTPRFVGWTASAWRPGVSRKPWRSGAAGEPALLALAEQAFKSAIALRRARPGPS
jgi:hypothetical protein